jgi:hypothetical protein
MSDYVRGNSLHYLILWRVNWQQKETGGEMFKESSSFFAQLNICLFSFMLVSFRENENWKLANTKNFRENLPATNFRENFHKNEIFYENLCKDKIFSKN